MQQLIGFNDFVMFISIAPDALPQKYPRSYETFKFMEVIIRTIKS